MPARETEKDKRPSSTPHLLFRLAGVLLMMAADQVMYVGLMQHRYPLRYSTSVPHPRTSVGFHTGLLIALIVAQIIVLWWSGRDARPGRWQWVLLGGAMSLGISLLYVFVLM